MPPRTQTFHFGRLNLLAPAEEKKEFLLKALYADGFETSRKFQYGFFDVVGLSIEDHDFATGRLVKYKLLLEGEVVDEEKKEIVEGGLPQGVVAKPPFFLHLQSSILAYHPISNRVSARQYRTMFARLIEAAHHDFFVNAEVQPMMEEQELIQAIGRFSRIVRIAVDLHPTNPSNRGIYGRIDRRLKEIEAQRYKEEVYGGEDGLNLEKIEEDDSYRGLLMAADGYGTGAVEGDLEDRYVSLSTDESPIKEEVLKDDDPQKVLRQLLEAFIRLIRREE